MMPNLVIFIIVLNFISLFDRCRRDKGTIVVEDGGQPFSTMMYIDGRHGTWGMNIRVNTLNDTARLGRRFIAPGKTGRLFLSDIYSPDSIAFRYMPYKATHGRLVVDYFPRME